MKDTIGFILIPLLLLCSCIQKEAGVSAGQDSALFTLRENEIPTGSATFDASIRTCRNGQYTAVAQEYYPTSVFGLSRPATVFIWHPSEEEARDFLEAALDARIDNDTSKASHYKYELSCNVDGKTSRSCGQTALGFSNWMSGMRVGSHDTQEPLPVDIEFILNEIEIASDLSSFPYNLNRPIDALGFYPTGRNRLAWWQCVAPTSRYAKMGVGCLEEVPGIPDAVQDVADILEVFAPVSGIGSRCVVMEDRSCDTLIRMRICVRNDGLAEGWMQSLFTSDSTSFPLSPSMFEEGIGRMDDSPPGMYTYTTCKWIFDSRRFRDLLASLLTNKSVSQDDVDNLAHASKTLCETFTLHVKLENQTQALQLPASIARATAFARWPQAITDLLSLIPDEMGMVARVDFCLAQQPIPMEALAILRTYEESTRDLGAISLWVSPKFNDIKQEMKSSE